jgi:hypothetical protein
MSGVELKTTKYFEVPQDDRDGGSGAATACSSESPPLRTASWEKAAAWIGVGAVGLVVLCLALIAVPMVTGIKLPKSVSPIDWWLWFGGAKSGQTFEKFVRDTATKNQQEWDEKYRQSPMYQFKGIQGADLIQTPAYKFDSQPMNSPSQNRAYSK